LGEDHLLVRLRPRQSQHGPVERRQDASIGNRRPETVLWLLQQTGWNILRLREPHIVGAVSGIGSNPQESGLRDGTCPDSRMPILFKPTLRDAEMEMRWPQQGHKDMDVQ